MLRWKGGAITDLTVPIIARQQKRLRTDEDTVDLVRRLAVYYPDAQIAGILNRQQRSTATGLPFTAGRVQGLRHHWNIDCHHAGPADGNAEQPMTIADAAAELQLPAPTLHRWISEGFLDAEHSPPARPAGSASPSRSGHCSSTRPPMGGSRCWKPPSPTNSPATRS